MKFNFVCTVLLSMGLILFNAGCDKKQDIKGASNQIDNSKEPAVINSDAPKQQENRTAPSAVSINLVKKKNKVRYILQNGVEIKQDFQNKLNTSKGEIFFPVIQVNGLINKQIEDKLNKKIKEDTEKEAKLFVNKLKHSPHSLICETKLNANNLVSFSMSQMYNTPYMGFIYRLTDGERLKLQDIFTQGTDYQSLLKEQILKQILYTMGEDYYILNKSRVSITPEQRFCISESELYIAFPNGEEGIVTQDEESPFVSIKIPLSDIDDYVQVLDSYSGTERKTHEKLELIERQNNFFTEYIGRLFEVKNGKVHSSIPKITGMQDKNFESEINNAIEKSIFEIINGGYLNNATKPPEDYHQEEIATIKIDVAFNHYGYLSLVRRVWSWESNKYQDLFKIYSYDIFKKKQVNMKNMIIDYLKDKADLQSKFVELANKSLSERGYKNCSYIYQDLIDKGDINFSKQGEIYISGRLKSKSENSQMIFEEYAIPYKEIVKLTPEEFFGN